MNDRLAPVTDDRLDARQAAHLLRRAGFAPSMGEINTAVDAGLNATVDDLVDRTEDTARHQELNALGQSLAAQGDINALRGWWLLRMRATARPLAARLAVMWHGHFATSQVKVQSAALMYQQLRSIERHGLGPFADLLLAMSRDPAMIVWLDGNQNVKGRPNENYAREVLELFALGVGNYDEHDIREAARAFTGWHQRNGRYRFVRRMHDDGPKTVLGVRGPHDGDDVVRIVTEHPQCAAFVATRLLHEFVEPDPPAALVAGFADVLRANGLDIRASLRVLFRSRVFHDERIYRARIKSPTEFTVGIARSLNLRTPAPALANAVSDMGQRLFEPPTVEGWTGHREWINSATMLVRLNIATRAVDGERLDVDALVAKYDIDSADAARAFCCRLTLDDRVPSSLTAALDDLDGDPSDIVRRGLSLLLTSPEYQLA